MSFDVSSQILTNSSQPIEWRAKTISDRQSTLFDLSEYEGSDTGMWGWLEEIPELGGNKKLPPNSPVRGQLSPDILPPNSPVRGQNNKLPPNLQIVTVGGQQYFLTPNRNRKQLPIETAWYEIKLQKGNPYLYLRWRSENKKKSRLLGRIDPLKYSD
jgi:hypothetical protein